ncbi:MAG: AbrB/MazE/SpoVT family DNA-binding domain-containing protein, partial [Candidatus Helarchaeota archaeon]
IKKIGNSWFIKIPPQIRKQINLHDNEEILINRIGNKLEIRFEYEKEANKAALLDLEDGFSLGTPKRIRRENLYKTARY